MKNNLKPGQLGMEVVQEDGSKIIVPLKHSTICLNMIVKNESHIIERCFDFVQEKRVIYARKGRRIISINCICLCTLLYRVPSVTEEHTV